MCEDFYPLFLPAPHFDIFFQLHTLKRQNSFAELFFLFCQAQQAGVMLSNEARHFSVNSCGVGLSRARVVMKLTQALASLAELPPEHSVELLEFVLDRAQER